MPRTTFELGLPHDVREAFQIPDQSVLTILAGGSVNMTLLVEHEQLPTIVRKLSPKIGETALQDSRVVGEHLASCGWETPVHLPTATGDYSVRDEGGSVWHRMSFINSDGGTPPPTSQLASAAGDMLGRWHATTELLTYTPQFVLDNFHDSNYHARKLLCYYGSLPSSKALSIADGLLENYSPYSYVGLDDRQIIHGDPKLDNMLFRNGKPFTLIDFDCLMLDSKWADVGDFLRSLSGRLLEHSGFNDETEQFVIAYHQANGLAVSLDEANTLARQATRRVATELGMRYLCDIIDKDYFTWDKSTFASRHDNHVKKAALQLEVARSAA